MYGLDRGALYTSGIGSAVVRTNRLLTLLKIRTPFLETVDDTDESVSGTTAAICVGIYASASFRSPGTATREPLRVGTLDLPLVHPAPWPSTRFQCPLLHVLRRPELRCGAALQFFTGILVFRGGGDRAVGHPGTGDSTYFCCPAAGLVCRRPHTHTHPSPSAPAKTTPPSSHAGPSRSNAWTTRVGPFSA